MSHLAAPAFAALCIAAPLSAQFTAVDRSVATDAVVVHDVFDDPISDSASDTSLEAGAATLDVEADAASQFSSAYAYADLSGEVDLVAGSLSLVGHAAAGIYVQGTGHAEASSRAALEILLIEAGSLVLDGDLWTDDTFEGFQGQDSHGTSSASFRVEAVPGGVVVLERFTTLGAADESFEGEVLALAPGRYRLVLEALAQDVVPAIEEVQGSLALGAFALDVDVIGKFALTASTGSIPLAAGGSQGWSLATGPSGAGAAYLVLGSATGIAPSFPVDGLELPLEPDPYFLYTLTAANTPPFQASFGLLDGDGEASAGFELPPGSNPALAGVTLHHAFVRFAPLGFVDFTSNPVSLLLVP